jgi:hypothetical protein
MLQRLRSLIPRRWKKGADGTKKARKTVFPGLSVVRRFGRLQPK